MVSNSTREGNRQGKGRRRTTTTGKIENATSRHLCFSRRKKGLMKKATELSVLTGAEVAIILSYPGEKVYSFGSPNVDHVVDKYLKGKMPTMNQPIQSVQRENNVQATIGNENKHDALVLSNYNREMAAITGPTYNLTRSVERFPSIMGMNSSEPSQGIPNSGIGRGGFPPYQGGLTGYGSGTKENGWFGGSGSVFGEFGVAGTVNNVTRDGFLNSYGISGNVGQVSRSPSLFRESGGMWFNDRLSYFSGGVQLVAGQSSIIVDPGFPNIEVFGSSGADVAAHLVANNVPKHEG